MFDAKLIMAKETERVFFEILYIVVLYTKSKIKVTIRIE